MNEFFALGLGVGTVNARGQWLEAYFPEPRHPVPASLAEALGRAVGWRGGNAAVPLDRPRLVALATAAAGSGDRATAELARRCLGSRRQPVLVLLERDEPPASVPEAYLKLHLLSHRLVRPHGLNLQGLFALLPTVAWTADGPVDLEELPERQLRARLEGRLLAVRSVDKFPPMADYVIPKGVRIADTARVRLGAWLGEGTTVMHEGFVNFNAGTEGPNMVEGRISAGVTVGAGSDLGGGSSTMGTLSGGGEIVISVGRDCLIGANAGIGIPLGDRCTVEAGLYVTAGTKVVLLDEEQRPVRTVKARELAGQSDLLFRRNSLTGAVECLTNRKAAALNEALHAHN
ncbi:MAG: 2,3,4,5-tetrahydropyridine-2,6-dicarboxylate N-succinyltransferase [Porticoccaceae bacterium]|nr:MAG: 2,3,4,5-tetrahydropyridine-2,6-dicarboxylate N-succinyltransferase [Porticoccaceae bacterium]